MTVDGRPTATSSVEDVAGSVCSAVVSSYGHIGRTAATIAQLRHLGVAPIVVFEHAPTIEAMTALAEEERQGDVWTWRARESDPPELVGTAMAALVRTVGPDWALFLDAGDLPLCRTGSLADVGDLQAGDVLSVARYRIAVGPDGPLMRTQPVIESLDDVLVHARPSVVTSAIAGERVDPAEAVAPLAPRTIARVEAVAAVRPRGLDVDTTDDRPWHRGLALELVIVRLPGDDTRPPVIDRYQLARLRQDGSICSAREVMDQVIPAFTSEEQYLAAIRSPQPWLSMAELICRQEGLEPSGRLELRTTPNRAIILAPPDRFIKIYGPWRQGLSSIERETTSLERLARDPDIPTPRLLAHGTLTDEWHYTVQSRVEGRPLARVRRELDSAALRPVAAWLGRFIHQLQAIPISEEEREAGWTGFHDEVSWRHRTASTLIDGFGGLPGQLVEQVTGWLPPMDELMPSAEDLVMTHGDLKDAHVLGDLIDGRFEPRGVIDFGSSRIGHPYWDLGPVWWCICRGDRALFTAFLAEAGLPGADDIGFPRRALAWAILRPCWGLSRPPDGDHVATLDELAEDWFGTAR